MLELPLSYPLDRKDFAGSINEGFRAIRERMKSGIDVVIEMLDARVPASSANPLIAQLTAGRPASRGLAAAPCCGRVRAPGGDGLFIA